MSSFRSRCCRSFSSPPAGRASTRGGRPDDHAGVARSAVAAQHGRVRERRLPEPVQGVEPGAHGRRRASEGRSLWNHYFLGGATAKLYYADGSRDGPKAYIFDTGNRDVRTEGMSYGMMISRADEQARSSTRPISPGSATAGNEVGPRLAARTARSTTSRPCSSPPIAGATDRHLQLRGRGEPILNAMLHKQDINGGVVNGVTDMFDHVEQQVVFVPYFGSATHTDPSYHLPAFYELWGRWAQGERAAGGGSSVLAGRGRQEPPVLRLDHAPGDGAQPRLRRVRRHRERRRVRRQRLTRRFPVRCLANGGQLGGRLRVVGGGSQPDRADRSAAGLLPEQGLTTYGNQYTLDGTALSTTHSLGLVASNGAASLAASDVRAWDFVSALWSTTPASATTATTTGCCSSWRPCTRAASSASGSNGR